jgi:nitrogen fixation protein NifB
VWHLRLPAAPRHVVLRRDRLAEPDAPAVDVADVLRYVAVARRALSGPLAVEIEGPGDPLASPETVLRSLALLHDHHPDVITGLVVDGPLMAEYAEDLAAFDLGYVIVRMDAATWATTRRLVDGATYRGETLERDDAARLLLEESRRAVRLARRAGIPAAVRFTLVPTVNAGELEAVARFALEEGASRVDVVAHAPEPGTPLARAGTPTLGEMAAAHELVARLARDVPATIAARTLAWLSPDRLQAVDLDLLAAADVLQALPLPDGVAEPAKVLPPRRTQLIAVATRDGTLVDTPLAGAHRLRVYAVTGSSIRCLGARMLPLDPRRRHDGVGDAQTFLQALVGCRALVATHLTPRAVTLLRAVGVLPVALGGPLEDVLDRVARGTLRQVEAGV